MFKVGDKVVCRARTPAELLAYGDRYSDYDQSKDHIAIIYRVSGMHSAYGVRYEEFTYHREGSCHWREEEDIELLIESNDLLKGIL